MMSFQCHCHAKLSSYIFCYSIVYQDTKDWNVQYACNGNYLGVPVTKIGNIVVIMPFLQSF